MYSYNYLSSSYIGVFISWEIIQKLINFFV